MARGGKRPGAGRKPGPTPETERRREFVRQMETSGIMPLELGLTLMRELWGQATDPETGRIVNMGKAMQANIVGKDIAPYCHPKLANMEHTGRGGGPIEVKSVKDMPDDELVALIDRLETDDGAGGGEG